jgi:SAM-dependent methyltransferase
MADVYEQLWNPREYLKQYYTKNYVADDEKAYFEFMVAWLKQTQRMFTRCIDFGCGCTLHNVMPLVPYVAEIHLADYLPENLTEIRNWLDDKPDAHDWDVYLHEVLKLEGNEQISVSDVDLRKQELRRKITTLKLGNIRNSHPLLDESTYDLVTSFYCVEAVTPSKAEWQSLMNNLCRLLAPGGTLILAAMRKSQFYTIRGKKFPATCVDETDFEFVLTQNGFDPARTEIQAVKISEWVEQGFDSICLVKAEQPL